MPDFISIVYLFTLTRKSNYNCLKDSKQLLNEPAIEKKEKKNINNNKTNTEEIKELLLMTSSCFSSRGGPNVLPIV